MVRVRVRARVRVRVFVSILNDYIRLLRGNYHDMSYSALLKTVSTPIFLTPRCTLENWATKGDSSFKKLWSILSCGIG